MSGIYDPREYLVELEMKDEDYGSTSSQVDPEDPRKIIVGVLTSAFRSSVKGFISDLQSRFPHLDFQFFEIPYNKVEKYEFKNNDFDIILLCHSIHNRRFAITDVLDALYDEFLAKADKTLGRARVGVVVHDFPEERLDTEVKYESEMEAFTARQPTTFKHANLAMIVGKLDESLAKLSDKRWEEVGRFLEDAKNAVSINRTEMSRRLYHKSVISCGDGFGKWRLLLPILVIVIALVILTYLGLFLGLRSGPESTTASVSSTMTSTDLATTTITPITTLPPSTSKQVPTTRTTMILTTATPPPTTSPESTTANDSTTINFTNFSTTTVTPINTSPPLTPT